jgi:hypothetical protein
VGSQSRNATAALARGTVQYSDALLAVRRRDSPRHGRRRDADIRTRAEHAVARSGGGKRVVYELVVGRPGDGDECGREEGEQEAGGYEKGGEW